MSNTIIYGESKLCFVRLIDDSLSNVKLFEEILRWFTTEELASLEMPFTAKRILMHYLMRGKNIDTVFAGVASKETMDFIELSDF